MLPGKYPTYARTGDASRRGNNKVFFDDTVTVIFQTSMSISHPTTFPEGHQFLDGDLSSTIFSVGTVTKQGVEQFVVIPTQNETFVGFVEDKLFAEDILNGNDVTDFGSGFTNKFGSKTIIRIPLPILSSTLLSGTNVSNFYYNSVRQCFEQIEYKNLETSVTSSGIGPYSNPFANRHVSSSRNNLLFNSLGIPHSRDFANVSDTVSTFWASTTRFGSLENYFSPSSLLLSGVYEATSSQFINVKDYISQPFLIERAVFEIPFSANEGWLNDKTIHSMMYRTTNGKLETDIGGPAFTFGLLNQVGTSNNTQRDLIMSGTVVPFGDSTDIFLQHFGHDSSFKHRTLNGFSSFDVTPACVVSGTTSFTGSIYLKMDAAKSSGRIHEGQGSVKEFSIGNSTLKIKDINTVCRSMSKTSGRSYFGRENVQPIAQPRVASRWSSYPSAPGYEDIWILNTNVSQKSPYIIHPLDKLIAYIQAPRSVLTRSFGSTSIDGPYFASSSNRVEIQSGLGYLTLYGSFVKEEIEFHDTLNQRLETNQIHEIIGNDPVLDQFDVAYDFELSGSYLDRIFSGSMTSLSNRLVVGSHFVPDESNPSFPKPNNLISDSFYKKSWISSGFRNVQSVGDERIFDTMVPGVDDIAKINSPTSLAFYLVGPFSGGSNVSAGANLIVVAWENIWDKSFPFEPRYSSIQRKISTQRLVVPYNSSLVYKPVVASIQNVIFSPLDTDNVPGMGGGIYYSDWTVNNPTQRGVKIEDFAKFYYGFGTRNNSRIYLGNMTGSVNNPDVEYKMAVDIVNPGAFGAGPKICGWKYGLFSGIPMYTKTIARRDRFGQLRDTLEQRIDTKFLSSPSPVSIKFVTKTGERTLPEYTYSSNLSSEATSSLPYFDNAVRNREEPLAYVRTNQTDVVI